MAKNEFLRGKPTDGSGEKALSFAFKAITFIIILAGVQAGAQKFAYSVNHNFGWAGKHSFIIHIFNNDYKIYSFWKMFYWALAYWKRTEI